ncbi:MAG: hypothetical protein ACLQGU_04320 [bacterium]
MSLTRREIRDAYRDILSAYNELFPVHPITRQGGQGYEGSFEKGDESLIDLVKTKTREVGPELKEGADQSGHAVTWRRGAPLDGLNESLKCRIETAIKFRI